MKKFLTILLILNINFVYADSWIAKTDFGGSKRVGAVGFSIGTKGYIGLGEGGNPYSSDFWQYDSQSNTWTQVANFGGGRRTNAVGFCIGNKGYAGLGYNGGSCPTDLWEYDPSLNYWIPKANLPADGRYTAIGFSIGNFGYIGQGQNNNLLGYYKDFWQYDPSTDHWTQKRDFPEVQRMGTAFSINTKGYVGIGNISSCYATVFYEYDPALDVWTSLADFPPGLRTSAISFSIQGKGYVGTGLDLHGPGHGTNDLWKYDPQTNSWSQKADFPGGSRYWAAAFVIGNLAYLGTGSNLSGSGSAHMRDFWAYNPDSNITTSVNIMSANIPEFYVYPNPAKQNLYIKATPQSELTIIDVMGNLIYKAATNDFSSKIDINNFPAGLYFIEARNGQYKEVRKFLKE